MKDWYKELRENRRVYFQSTREARIGMEHRALLYSSLCIHTGWKSSQRYWKEERLNPLPVAKTFLENRFSFRPSSWVPARSQAKSRFAKVLCGAWDRDDSCNDILMIRHFPKAKVSAIGQWALWLHKAYPKSHPDDHGRVIQEHINVLRWIRTGRRES